MTIRHLTAEEVIAIHRRILETIGGSSGIRDAGLIFSCCQRPQTILAGREMYTDLFSKAAAFLESLVNYHPFIDGNKRTAYLATKVFLIKNGVLLQTSQKEGLKFMKSVAMKKQTIQEIKEWLRSHSDLDSSSKE